MSKPATLDDVLFAFHRAVHVPTPADVAKWVGDYPQYADEIRAHAVEIVDMEALARLDEIEGAPAGVSLAPRQAPASGPTRTLREAVRGHGLTLADLADEIGIAAAIVSDVNSGRIVAETVSAKFARVLAAHLGEMLDDVAAIITGAKERPATAMLKARSGAVEGRPMTWEEAVLASDMDEDRKAFWLSDED